MYRFMVVTDHDSAPGFRMAGVEVIAISDPEEARTLLPSLLLKDDTGIVAINEDFMKSIDEKLMDRIEKSYRPLIIPIPAGTRSMDKSGYVERLLRKAIGYNIVVG
ncbi:MAG: V-type ATP synthase subunit F [Methanomicrobiales archaeon]|nr:V-type ATP synthase subunit F [Methanomicrobiales archaeon]